MSAWSFDDIASQDGRLAVVTGANTGLGFETARMLAAKGAEVVLACRSAATADDAARRIRASVAGALVHVEPLDLSDLDDVAAFAERVSSGRSRLGLLVANAGVMVPPLARTRQGFELQIGTNHLGHFALVGRLLPLLRATPNARVVVVSSLVHHFGRIDLEDLLWQRRPYQRWAAYAQSKLANLLFVREFQQRLARSGSALRVTAAHPGWSSTELQRTDGLSRFFSPYLAMTAAQGALPTMRAATDAAAEGASYWGPSGLGEMWGHPVPARQSPRARDAAVGERLWARSEELTGVRFGLDDATT